MKEQINLNQYQAGVCNIGPQEITRRRNLGWGSLLVAAVLLVILMVAKVSPVWRLFVFFPAALAASGFLQAQFHFCTGFARRGLYNFGPLGTIEKIEDPGALAKDRRRGNQITLYAILIGIIIAIAVLFI